MLIKLAFGCVYTSPCCSATMSGVSFFSQIAKQLWKSTKQFYCSKLHYARKRKINNSKDKTIPSAFNHHDERKCTFFVIRAVQSLQVLWHVDGSRLLGQFTWSVLILLSVISCKHFPKHSLAAFTSVPAYFHLVGVTTVRSKTCIIRGWWPDTDPPGSSCTSGRHYSFCEVQSAGLTHITSGNRGSWTHRFCLKQIKEY